MKAIFEEMSGTYCQEDDYLIPVLADTGDYPIGKCGRMRRIDLKEYRKSSTTTMCWREQEVVLTELVYA